MSSAKSRRGAGLTLKRDVVLANRIVERFGLSNAFGHASARIPGTDTFFMPTRRSPGLASASTLLVLDTEGKILSGRGTPNSELWIHARIYAARPDVGGVVHAHPPACVCLTQIGPPHHRRAPRRARGHRGRVHAGGERRHSAAHARRRGRGRRAPARLHPRGSRERERPDQPACRGAGLGILRARGGAKTAGRLESSDGKDAPARPAHFRPGPASCTRFLSISVISIRRFFFRPSGVSFSARPEAIMRSGGMPTSCR